MGQNKKSKSKKRENTAGSEQPRRRRWGSEGSSAATDGEDDTGSYTRTSGRNRKKRGSGKLRGHGHDDNPILNDGRAPAHSKGSGGEEDSRTSERGTESEASRAKPDGGQRSSASTLDTEARLSRVLPPEETCAISIIDRQREEQVQAKDSEGAVGRSKMDEDRKKGGVKDGRGILIADACTGSPVDEPTDQLNPASTLESCSGTGVNTHCCEALDKEVLATSSTCSTRPLPSAKEVVVVPVLALRGGNQGDRKSLQRRSSREGTAGVIMDNTPYSLAWTGGRKGRLLMRSVEDTLSGWLCTQHAKGTCIETEITGIKRATGCMHCPLGRLAGELVVPEPVVCALGLRFRDREWDELLNKIVAASEASAPRPADAIPLDAFAALAREEAAGFELAELELRQALHAEASRIAPRACPSAAVALFQRLDPTATGIVVPSELARLALRLLRLPPTDDAEHAPRSSRTYHTPDTGLSPVAPGAGVATATPSGTPALSRDGGRRPSTTGYVTPATGGAFCASPCGRIRQLHGVIERLARTAAAAASSPPKKGEDHRNTRGNFGNEEETRFRRGGSGRISTAGGEEPRGRTLALGAPPARHSPSSAETSTVGKDYEKTVRCDHAFIALSTFCRFAEGKRFDGARSLEGFLRTLSSAGRLLTLAAEPGIVAKQARIIQDQTFFSAGMGRHNTSPTPERARRTSSAARWGTQGLRRASSQFSHNTPGSGPPAAMPVGEKRTKIFAQAHRGGYGGVIRSARSGGGERYPTSRSGGPAVSGVRGGDVVAQALSSFDSEGSGTLSSAEFISAASQVAGLVSPMCQEWGDILTKRFARSATRDAGLGGGRALWRRGSTGPGGGGGRSGGVRWLSEGVQENTNGRLDIAALVDFLRPKSFSLSVMTPFGLVELSLEDPCLTLGGLREIIVNKMFWRQHNCQVRRSDRNNFTLSRYYGAVPLNTESSGQKRRLVLDVLRPGELIFVTDRPTSRSRHEEPRIPAFEYMMGARRHPRRADVSATNVHESNKGTGRTDRASPSSGRPRRRQTSLNPAVCTATNAGGLPRRFSAPTPSGSSPPQSPQPLAEHAASPPISTLELKKQSTSMKRVSSRNRGVSTTATREDATTDLNNSRLTTRPPGHSRSTPRAGIVEPSPERLGEEACFEGDEKGDASGPDSPSTEGRTEAGYDSCLVFDWNVDQVERWVCETLELKCYRKAFRANKIDGSSLAGLTQESLVEELGVKNAFHSRKIVLHLDRLLAETLGIGAHRQIPRSIPSWRNREFLMWCWQNVGIQHRPTLALLHQAGVDGLVLLAMESDSWLHLAETGPSRSCIAPLESIRRASEALLPRSQTGDAALVLGDSSTPGDNEVDLPMRIVKGGDEPSTDVNEPTGVPPALEESKGTRTSPGGTERKNSEDDHLGAAVAREGEKRPPLRPTATAD